MKWILFDLRISTIKISRTDKISSPDINRINITSTYSLTNNRIWRYIKIYGSQKQRIKKIITNFVKNIDTTLIAKEIAEHTNSLMDPEYIVDFVEVFMKVHIKICFKIKKITFKNVIFYLKILYNFKH